MTAGVLAVLPSLNRANDDGWSSLTAGPDGGDLIEAHLQGDQTAFGRLDRLYRNRLISFINRMVRDRDRAEELVQETFLRVHRHGQRFDPTRKFSTWIYTIAGNLARNDLRRRRRSPVVALDAVNPDGQATNWVEFAEDPAPRPDDAQVSRSMMELIHKTVDRLSPIHRRVFVLREIEGKTYEEIAEAVGCDLGTVKSRLNRARRAFARRIAPFLD
jgi:RNA polymerase sigma-70 factor (ECF subfamily)